MPLVGQLLTRRTVYALPPAATALEAARLMAEHRIGAMLVIDRGERLVGIFTERDLMTRVIVAGLDPAATPLERVMTREVYTAVAETKVAAVRREIQARHIRHLPVVQAGRVIGMLSLRDLLRADLDEKAHELEQMTDYIQRTELGPLEG
jgi:CBS domain-containing protein